MSDNRCRIARENAGLSVGQAAKLLGMDRGDLDRIEAAEAIDADVVPRLCELYMVRPEWITGEVPRRDYARVERFNGAEKLTPHDRDIIAEFAASIPGRKVRT